MATKIILIFDTMNKNSILESLHIWQQLKEKYDNEIQHKSVEDKAYYKSVELSICLSENAQDEIDRLNKMLNKI